MSNSQTKHSTLATLLANSLTPSRPAKRKRLIHCKRRPAGSRQPGARNIDPVDFITISLQLNPRIV
jgi:hypothetical protein